MSQVVTTEPGSVPPYPQPGYPQPQYPPAGYPPQPGYPNPAYAPGQMPMQPITQQQPGAEQWMSRPELSDCPPGLEYLSQINQLIVKQQVELIEVVTSWESQNKYKIYNTLGQPVYNAAEDSNCCARQCCGASRGFVINITDNLGQTVIKLERSFKCCACCCWCAFSSCCAFIVKVKDRDDNLLGTVRQSFSCWRPKYTIYSADGDSVGRIVGPWFVCNLPCCGDVEFPITSPANGDKIGMVAKQWSGWGLELFTDADTFSVSFPVDMDVRTKATFIGACFLIDFMYFEQNSDKNKNKNR